MGMIFSLKNKYVIYPSNNSGFSFFCFSKWPVQDYRHSLKIEIFFD